MREATWPSKGNGRERVQLFGLNLVACCIAAIDLGTSAIAAIQDRAQVGVGLLRLLGAEFLDLFLIHAADQLGSEEKTFALALNRLLPVCNSFSVGAWKSGSASS